MKLAAIALALILPLVGCDVLGEVTGEDSASASEREDRERQQAQNDDGEQQEPPEPTDECEPQSTDSEACGYVDLCGDPPVPCEP